MTNLTDNSMGYLLYLPKQYLMPCQSQQQSKMRHILSHSWLKYKWRTKAATDNLHHHRSMQIKRNNHTFSSKNWMETMVYSAKTKIWASFHIPRKLRHSKTNEQSGFNAEQIEKDIYPDSKTVWKSNLIYICVFAYLRIWAPTKSQSRAIKYRRHHLKNNVPKGSFGYLRVCTRAKNCCCAWAGITFFLLC